MMKLRSACGDMGSESTSERVGGAFHAPKKGGLKCVFSVIALVCLITGIRAQPTWKKAYGAFASDDAWDAIVTSDDGILVIGSTGSFGGGSSDIYLFKIDGDGNRLWSRTIGGPQIEQASAACLMPDGGFLIVGSTNADFENGYDGLAIRTNMEGEVLWQRTYGGDDWDFFNGVAVKDDGTSWVVGQTFSGEPNGRAWVLGIDENGDVLLDTGPAGASESEARSVIALPGGGCVIAGGIMTASRGVDVYLSELDPAGDVVWAGGYGGDSLDVGHDVIPTIDGGYSVIGSTRSFSSFLKEYHLKVDGSGGVEWERSWGQVNDQEGFDHVQLPDGRYASNGYASHSGAGGKDMYLLIADESGEFMLGQTQGGGDDDMGRALLRVDGGYLMCGITYSYGAGSSDVFLVRTNEVGYTESDEVSTNFDPISVAEIDPQLGRSSVFPNPGNGEFSIRSHGSLARVRVFDGLGRVVFDQVPVLQQTEFQLDVPAGLYRVLWTGRNGASAQAPLIVETP
jgi:hypothetical protein